MSRLVDARLDHPLLAAPSGVGSQPLQQLVRLRVERGSRASGAHRCVGVVELANSVFREEGTVAALLVRLATLVAARFSELVAVVLLALGVPFLTRLLEMISVSLCLCLN